MALKLNGTHRLLVCANDVNVLSRSVHSIQGVYSIQGFWWGNRRERNHLGDSGIDGRIILEDGSLGSGMCGHRLGRRGSGRDRCRENVNAVINLWVP